MSDIDIEDQADSPENYDTYRTMNRDLDVPIKPDRAQSVIALVLAGATYGQVAKTLDFPSAEAARSAAEHILADTVTQYDREQYRTLTAMRLDRLWQAIYRKASDPKHPEQLAAARVALSTLDRAAKLHGLDAPTEITLHNPSNDELREWVRTMEARQLAQFPEEADVVDAEVEDDE